MTPEEWLPDLDLGVDTPWPRMGTRSLRDQPWLVTDTKTQAELALRVELIDSRRAEVLAESERSAAATQELEELVRASGAVVSDGSSSLERLGRSVQEDFCLLRRGVEEWELEAAILCFPSRWRLADKVGRPLTQVHGPTPRYQTALASRITSLLDKLGERVVLRRNFFLHPDPALFQPTRPSGGDPVVPADRCAAELYVRSERQTLRALPESGYVAFSIRVQQCSLSDLLASRRAHLVDWITRATPELRLHTGVSDDQRAEILRHLS